MRVALVEDDTVLAEVISAWLQDAGYDCRVFGEGNLMVRSLSRDTVDLIILDWMLPDTNGIQLLHWIREHIDWPIPVIFVTGRDSEQDIVQALNDGADDYITKPVKHLELIARITAVTRRKLPQESAEQAFDFSPYTIDTNTRSVSLNEQSIDLTQKEFDLTLFLFRNSGRLLSRGYILETVWGRNPDVNTRTVDTHISRLRNKLKLKPVTGWRLKAVYQHGYRLERAEQVK